MHCLMSKFILIHFDKESWKLLYLKELQFFDYSKCTCYLSQTGVELELAEQMPLLEWFANNYKNFGECLLSCLELFGVDCQPHLVI